MAFIFGTRLGETLNGVSGENDFIFALAGDDDVVLASGNDRLFAGRGDDTLADFIGAFGDTGDDTIFGGFGDDSYRFSSGDDVFFGGAGFDQVTLIGGEDDFEFEDLLLGRVRVTNLNTDATLTTWNVEDFTFT
ncbi:MAG: calcium-binding protein [Pikeienuella sp.]